MFFDSKSTVRSPLQGKERRVANIVAEVPLTAGSNLQSSQAYRAHKLREISKLTSGIEVSSENFDHLKLRLTYPSYDAGALSALAPLVPRFTRVAVDDRHLADPELRRFLAPARLSRTFDLHLHRNERGCEWRSDIVFDQVRTVHVVGDGDSLESVRSFLRCCPNISAFDLSRWNGQTVDKAFELLKPLPPLMELNLRGVSGVDCDLLRLIAEYYPLEELVRLDLSHHDHWDGDGLASILAKAGTLRHLNLYNCRMIQEGSIAEALQHAKVLQQLFLNNCGQIGDRSLEALCSDELLDLNINYCQGVGCLGLEAIKKRCPKLRTLYMKGVSAVNGSLLDDLLVNCTALERVDVSECSAMTSEILASLRKKVEGRCHIIAGPSRR